MTNAVVKALPIAVGLLLASIPIVILAVVLVTKRPVGVSWAFLAGWVLGLGSAGALVILLADVALLSGGSGRWASVVGIALGVLLLWMAVRKWRGRPRAGEPPDLPGWAAKVETMTSARAFGLAFLLGAVNPKNLVLVASGATVIAEATQVPREQLGALAVFVLVGSLGVAAPPVVSQVLGSRSARVLDAADRWMSAKSAVIMTGVLGVLGALMIVNGVGGL